MSAYALQDEPTDRLRGGLAGALVLHLAAAGAILAFALIHPSARDRWGGTSASVGAIQASMVDAIPLPPKAPPVDKAVLASEDVSAAPVPPKTAAQPPPLPTDLLIKGRIDPHTKIAPVPTLPPKHPQPTRDSAKAQFGDNATQLPQSVTQLRNGTAAATIEDRAFGSRYAYYREIVSRMVSQNWYTAEADPRASQGKHVLLSLEIERDGSPANVKILAPSGSPSLDTSALRAVQRVDSFGPLPAGDHVTVQLSFEYHQP